MRKVSIDQVLPGDKISRNIYNSAGQILLRKGTVLSAKYVERLKRMGFQSVFIDDGLINDVIPEENISEETRVQAVTCLAEIANNFKYSGTIKIDQVKKVVKNIVEDIINNREHMLNLQDIRTFDDYTFHHSVNVTVISVLIGVNLYFNYDRLCDLGLGVLLHDIGKTRTPVEILNKPGKLTEDEYRVIQQHTWYGFEVLRQDPEIKITSAHIALQHHERYNGSGYPRQLKGNDIIEFARIAAVADVYDAMTNDRCYRKKMPIHKVRQYLADNSGTLFDPYIVERFIEKIALYPQGTRVTLNDGRSGLVIKNNNLAPARPVIRLFWYHGKPLPNPVEVDLTRESSLQIVDADQDKQIDLESIGNSEANAACFKNQYCYRA